MKLRTNEEKQAYLEGFEMCARCIEEHLPEEGKQILKGLLMIVRDAVKIKNQGVYMVND